MDRYRDVPRCCSIVDSLLETVPTRSAQAIDQGRLAVMANVLCPAGMTVNGTRVAKFNIAAFAVYGRICHLCGAGGADTVDHLLPTSTHPELRWDLANVRPAHKSCNSIRKDAPLREDWAASAW